MIQQNEINKLDLSLSVEQHAAHFRALAIGHLKNGRGIVAEGFRKDYQAALGVPFEEFLEKQGNNGVWGTYIELSAIAELFGVKVVITSKDQGEETTWVLYEPQNKEQDKVYPAFHIHCEENRHFTYKGLEVGDNYYPHHGQTRGNGNCLYNAISQGAIAYATLQQKPDTLVPEENPVKAPEQDFILESQRRELLDYNEKHGAPSDDKSSVVLLPNHPYEMMDRLLAIELALAEEDRVLGKSRSQNDPSFFKKSPPHTSCSSELKDEKEEMEEMEDVSLKC